MPTRRRKKQINTRRSLTAAGLVRPGEWGISHAEAAEALEISIEQIVKVVPLAYQICIVYIDRNGKKISSFFSYRRFSRFQQAVQNILNKLSTLESLEIVAQIIEYDLCHFRYDRAGIANGIWAAVLKRQSELLAALY